eukprot:s2038_g3.t1
MWLFRSELWFFSSQVISGNASRSCAEESSMQEAYMPALSLAYAFTVLSAKPSGAADVPAAAAQCLQRLGARLDEKSKFNFSPVLGQHSMTEPAILRWQQGFCIVWKPPGWEVTVSDGEDQVAPNVYSSGPQLQDWLGDRFPDCPIARDSVASYGLVHRLDRDTSGMVMWAPTYQSYYALRLAFATERVQKEYLCLCDGWLPQEPRLLEGGIQRIPPKEPGAGRHTSQVSSCGRRARTEIRDVAHALGPGGEPVSFVKVRIYTGRLHQIRVHLSHEGHPLVGDGTYGGSCPAWVPRIFLHAAKLVLLPDAPDAEPVSQDSPSALQAELPLPKARAMYANSCRETPIFIQILKA